MKKLNNNLLKHRSYDSISTGLSGTQAMRPSIDITEGYGESNNIGEQCKYHALTHDVFAGTHKEATRSIDDVGSGTCSCEGMKHGKGKCPCKGK